jgi:RNA polymerase sigma-B factor
MQTLAPPPRQRPRRIRESAPLDPADRRRLELLFVRHQRHGDLAARRELIERFLPLAHKLARRYERPNESFEDLFQVASLGLVKAIDRYDATRGYEFTSYAVPTIVGELRRYFRDSGWAVHLPRGMQERVLSVAAAMERLSSDLGSPPAPKRVAAYLGLPVEDVLDALVAAAGHDTVSLDGPASRSDDEGPTIADALGQIEEGFELAEQRPALARGLRALPPRERTVLYLRFAEDLNQSEIARRLGVSQMHVSRLLQSSLERMRIVAGAG